MNTSNNLSLHSLAGITRVFGDNINTDLIMPSQYLDNPDPNYFAQFVMSGINPNFIKEIRDIRNKFELPVILVAGKNFGSGSSREQAPQGLKHAGISAVIAESFNTIFFRNAVNIGLPIAIIPNIINQVKDNFHLELNLKKGVLQILNPKASKIEFHPLELFLLQRLEHGGLLPELKDFVKKKQQ
jgi:3-isopropylmalate/(R)-2-methylmalate dehydratase small subunit